MEAEGENNIATSIGDSNMASGAPQPEDDINTGERIKEENSADVGNTNN